MFMIVIIVIIDVSAVVILLIMFRLGPALLGAFDSSGRDVLEIRSSLVCGVVGFFVGVEGF